ncbi:MAG: hypothetical protein OXR66_05800 [Candidatus Woesearchaeota archaeon]|nr:hypothetical protein [Candidatus Woesearchaeota archaeon]
MGEEMITTGVDDLLEYLKDKDRVAMQDAATALHIQPETVQAWVDFLVEEKILGIEYKFTKPYIYLNRETKKAKHIEPPKVTIKEVKKKFTDRAARKQIPAGKISELWKSHVIDALQRKKTYFTEQAQQRQLDPEQLWDAYEKDLLARC